MRIKVDIELDETEAQDASTVRNQFLALCEDVDVRVLTDKDALKSFIETHIDDGAAEQEMQRRLDIPAFTESCIEVIYEILLDPARPGGKATLPFLELLKRLPEQKLEKVKESILNACIDRFVSARFPDCASPELLVCGEVISYMVKTDIVSADQAVLAATKLLQNELTRSSGVTLLGKLVEICLQEVLAGCSDWLINELRTALSLARGEPCYQYAIDYIKGPFGWDQGIKPRFLNLTRSTVSEKIEKKDIVALATGSCATEEVVVTSSLDGTVTFYHESGNPKCDMTLTMHYAVSLHVADNCRTVIVAGNGRDLSTRPAIITYTCRNSNDEPWVEGRWSAEPENARILTAVKSISGGSTNSLHVCCAVNGIGVTGGDYIYHYDTMRTLPIMEYRGHHDVITCLNTTRHGTGGESGDNLLISGSRDTTVNIYDTRANASKPLATASHHSGTVTTIERIGDYLVTAGLDQRFVVKDMRVLTQNSSPQPALLVKEFEAPILSIAVAPSSLCAVSTSAGLHFGLLNQAAFFKADSGVATQIYNSVAWNKTNSDLFCAGSTSLDLIFVAP